MLIPILVDELSQRCDPCALNLEMTRGFRNLAEALIRENEGHLPASESEAVAFLLPELIRRAGVNESPGALYPTHLYRDRD